MSYVQVISFAVIALFLVISPGPNGLLIAKTVPASGKKAGMASVFGFIVAFYLHGMLSVLGVSVLLTNSAEAFMLFKVLGALYLAWIGIKSLRGVFTSAPQLDGKVVKSKRNSLSKSFLDGFLTNALNPKVSMFYLAAFPQFIPVGEHALWYALLLISIHALLNLVWFSSLVMLLARLGTMAKQGVFSKCLKVLTGCVFLGFGIKLLTLERG